MENPDTLFERLREVTGITDIGYHKIEEGRLRPVTKTNTDILGIEKWKNVHRENPVFIEDTPILLDIINTKKPAFVNNVATDARSADAFFLFGIDSILVVPVKNQQTVEGIICIASIGKHHEFSIEEVETCEKLITDHFNY